MTKSFFGNLDWGLIAPVIVLVALSLTTIFSINFILFKNQLFFLILAIFVFLFFSQIDYKIIQRYGLPIYVGSIILLLLVLVFGFESRGAVRWLSLIHI